MSDFKIQLSSHSVVEKFPILKKLTYVIANDDIFHLPALSEVVVKCRPHTFISVDVAPTIQTQSTNVFIIDSEEYHIKHGGLVCSNIGICTIRTVCKHVNGSNI